MYLNYTHKIDVNMIVNCDVCINVCISVCMYVKHVTLRNNVIILVLFWLMIDR